MMRYQPNHHFDDSEKYVAGFHGDYRFLSNFYALDQVSMGGLLYPTTEHAYQAAKTDDKEHRLMILNASSPNMAKKLGRHVTLRPDWDLVKRRVMKYLVRQKFYRSEVLRYKLVDTYPRTIVEVNIWGDVYWGVTQSGGGENHLGRILMSVRKELRFQLV